MFTKAQRHLSRRDAVLKRLIKQVGPCTLRSDPDGFAVLVRSSFGVRGNKLPALLRAIVACGWFGIQCWIGGNAIHVIGNILVGGALTGPAIPFIGLNTAQLCSFFVFWALHLYFIRKGPDSVRWIETITAPVKIVVVLALLAWAWDKAGGFGDFINAPSQFEPGAAKAGQFWAVFAPSLKKHDAEKAGSRVLRYLRRFDGEVYAVGRGDPLPAAELASVSVAAESVPEALEQCRRAGIPRAIVHATPAERIVPAANSGRASRETTPSSVSHPPMNHGVLSCVFFP